MPKAKKPAAQEAGPREAGPQEARPQSAGFEEQLARLQVITGALEKGDLSLEESLNLYKEGVGIAASCRKTLDKARHTVKIYTEAGLKDFIAENNGPE